MSESIQKPFLTVETGEAYQPLRLAYEIKDEQALRNVLDNLQCLEKNSGGSWNWFWKAEADELHFESLEDYQRNPNNPTRLGSFSIRDGILFLSLASFKRACLAVPFFHRLIDPTIARVDHADFMNRVYSLDERLPHGFSDLFSEAELKRILAERLQEFSDVKAQCEQANSMEEALDALTSYTDRETHKKLPFVERYEFIFEGQEDPDFIFLGFYVFLRGRELVAIRRWYGAVNYTLADAIDEAVEEVFGSVGIDIVE